MLEHPPEAASTNLRSVVWSTNKHATPSLPVDIAEHSGFHYTCC